MQAVADKRAEEVRDLASAIYEQNAGFLFALAMQNARNEADAEEAISESLISFMRSYEVGGPAPPLPWLILTLKRQCWRQKRDAHLERQVGQEVGRGDDHRGTVIASLSSPGTDFETRIADVDAARRRLAELKTDERTALGAFAAGFSYKEIASRLRWTYTKVDRCIREGRTALAAA